MKDENVNTLNILRISQPCPLGSFHFNTFCFFQTGTNSSVLNLFRDHMSQMGTNCPGGPDRQRKGEWSQVYLPQLVNLQKQSWEILCSRVSVHYSNLLMCGPVCHSLFPWWKAAMKYCWKYSSRYTQPQKIVQNVNYVVALLLLTW